MTEPTPTCGKVKTSRSHLKCQLPKDHPLPRVHQARQKNGYLRTWEGGIHPRSKENPAP